MPKQIVVDGQALGTAPDDATDDELAQLADELSSAPTATVAAQAPTAPRRGPIRRFLAPIGQALKSIPATVGLAAEVGNFPRTAATDPARAVALARAARDAVLEPSREQFTRALEAGQEGNYGEAALRGAASLPIAGPAIADIVDTAREGNIAGALGQATVLAAPFKRLPRFAAPSTAAGILHKRAAARIMAAQSHSPKTVELAEEVAGQVLGGTRALDPGAKLPGIGVGSLNTILKRAKARRAIASQERAALERIDLPVDVSPAIRGLEAEAASLETLLPAVSAVGPMGPRVPMPARASTRDPARVAALRDAAEGLRLDAEQFGRAAGTAPHIPGGELFRQIRSGSSAASKAARTEPGTQAATAAAAEQAFQVHVKKVAKDVLEPQGVPVGDVLNAYKVWNNAALGFRRAKRATLSEKGFSGLKELLLGRLFGNVLRAGGGATLGATVVGGPAAGVAGALAGIALGRSTFWNTTRATTYHHLAELLNRGDVNAAAQVLARAEAAYLADQGIKDRERHRKAQQALQEQAKGVVAP